MDVNKYMYFPLNRKKLKILIQNFKDDQFSQLLAYNELWFTLDRISAIHFRLLDENG